MPINKDYNFVQDRLRDALPFIAAIKTYPAHMLDTKIGEKIVKITWKNGLVTGGSCHFRLGLEGKSAQATAPIEDAETSAMGRALAAGGYFATGQYASFEEMDRVKVFAGEAAAEPVPEPVPEPEPEPDTSAWDEAIVALAEHANLVSELYPGLTRRQVREMPIEKLQQLVKNVQDNAAVAAEAKSDELFPQEREPTGFGPVKIAPLPPVVATGPSVETITSLFKERELGPHDGMQWSKMSDSARQEIHDLLLVGGKRKYQAKCKGCGADMFWGQNERTGKPMPFNADGAFHHSTCTALEKNGGPPKDGKLNGIVKPSASSHMIKSNPIKAKTPDDVPDLDNLSYPAVLDMHRDATDNVMLQTLARTLYMDRSGKAELCSEPSAKLLYERMTQICGSDNHAHAWTLALTGSCMLGDKQLLAMESDVDRLIWWMQCYDPRSIRKLFETIGPELAVEFPELAPWLTDLPEVEIPGGYATRAILLWAKGLLANGGLAGFYKVTNTADCYLLLKAAWERLRQAEYYGTEVQDMVTIYGMLATDERVMYLIDTAIDDGLDLDALRAPKAVAA